MTNFLRFILFTFVFLIVLYGCECHNKYSAEANKKAPVKKVKTDPIVKLPSSLRDLDNNIFRIAKLNLVWIKAKHRLTEPKLQSLFNELNIHQKEEFELKHLKADGGDKDGLKEARLRTKLMSIMTSYGLEQHFADTDDPELVKKHKPHNDGSNYVAKDVFEDHKLNKLWAKAERAGFTHEELEALKEEFQHYQNKIDEYKTLLEDVKAGDPTRHENSIEEDHEAHNEIDHKADENQLPGNKKTDFIAKTNLLRDKIVEIKSGYDYLADQTAQGPDHKEFVEPKVQELWRTAQKANFSPEDLKSLKEELQHYETRLLKLRHLHTEAAREAANKGKQFDIENSTDFDRIKKHARTVEKLHMELETRILQKHTEL